MFRPTLGQPVNRRDLLRLAGGAAAVPLITGAALPRSARARQGTAKEAVVVARTPYTNWNGVRFWTNTGVPSRLMFEPLLDLDDTLLPAPGLAESWEVVSSTLSRYTLRSGLVWSDGTPLTADDVVFSMNLTFHPDVNNLMASEISTIAGAAEVRAGTATTLAGVRALDEVTIEIETAVPDTSILRTLALRWWAPLPTHVFESVVPADLMASPEMLQPPVVSGPFIIDRIEPEKWYEMSANTSYWRGKAKLDKLTFVTHSIGDPVALASQEAFDFMVLQNQPDVASAIAENPNYTVTFVEYIQPYRIQFNTSLAPFQDYRMRKAVAYAIDRDTLCNEIYQGFATPQLTDFLGDLLDPSAEVYSYDPDKARQLLAEANWDSGQVIQFERQAPAAGAAPNLIEDAEVAALQQWLGDVGITLEIRTHPDSATYNDFIRPAAASPEFGAYQNPHRRYDMFGALEMKTYLASDPPNYAYWQHAEADALVQQAIAAATNEEYVAIGRQLSVIVADQCPYIPTKAVQVGVVAHKDFSGYTPLGEYYFAHTRPYDWDVTGA